MKIKYPIRERIQNTLLISMNTVSFLLQENQENPKSR